MDRRIEKTIKEEEKLKEQLKAIQDRLNNVEEKREGFEKETLYKTFKETEISLEEYQLIVKTAVDDYKGLNEILTKGVNKNEQDI